MDKPLPPQKQIAGWALSLERDKPSTHINTALTYIATLNSHVGRTSVTSTLRILASMLGYPHEVGSRGGTKTVGDISSVPWHRLDRPTVLALIEIAKRDGKSDATRNAYLSILKGVAREALLNLQMTDHQFALIEKVQSVRGSRLPAGRALHIQEMSDLVDHWLNQEGLAGTRDAALLGALFGCGPQRAELVTIDTAKINPKTLRSESLVKATRNGSWSHHRGR